MDELIKYTNYNKLKYDKSINYFLYIIICILIVLCVMIHYITINYYYYNKCIVTKYEDKYYLKMYVLENDIKKINKENIMIVNNIKYKYNIYHISDILVDDNYNKYYEVYIKSNLNYKLNNNIFEIKIEWDKKLLNKIIYDFLGGDSNDYE